MSGRSPAPATSPVDLATVSAVAELVIQLSIALRSHLIYGAAHPMARRNAGRVKETLQRALELQQPIALHFTASAVFCGPHCLERGHPIFRAFAERMWRHGVAGLRLEGGVGEEEVGRFLDAVVECNRSHATRQQAERILREAPLQHVHFQFLRNVLAFEARDEAGPLDRQGQERIWEDLMRQVAAAAAAAALPAPVSPPDPASLGPSADDPAQDYAAAVIDFMKQLQREQRQDSVLQQTEVGRQIGDLVARINPELRHQLLASAVAAPEVTPEVLQRLSLVVGRDQILESLRRLNESGQALPPSALRTLTMFTALGEDAGFSVADDAHGESFAAVPRRSAEELHRLLDGLLAEDQGSSYMTPAHDRLVTNTDRRLQLRVLRPPPGAKRLFTLAPEDVEQHFVQIGFELLADPEADRELGAVLCREAQRTFLRLVGGGSLASCRQAMALGAMARDVAAEAQAEPLVWATDEVLGPLRERLAGSDRVDAEAAVELMVEIGEPAIPVLLAVLADGDSIPARKRAIEALVAMRVDPVSHLLPLLGPQQPWYLQRNALVVLRRRRDGRALHAGKKLWSGADPRLKLEILRYVVEMGDRDRFVMIQEAVGDRSPELALAAMHMAVSSGDGPTFTAVLRLADATPGLEVGGPFHLDVLRLLVRSPDPAGRRYVQTVAQRRKPLMPWLRDRFRRDVEALLSEKS